MSPERRSATSSELRERGLLLVWQQADAAGPMPEVERAEFILRRLYPEMSEAWFVDVVGKFAARYSAGTWQGFQRPGQPKD